MKIERRLRNAESVNQLGRQLGQRFPQSREWSAYQRGAFDE
jgi:type IV pilus assembly protein PilF